MYATPSSSRRWSSAASPIASDGDLREAVAAEPRLDGRDDALDQLQRDRALDARALEAAQELGAVERLPAAVALDDPQRRLLEALEGREARVAVEALATPADGLAGIAHARLEHACLANAAGRADHLPTTRSSVGCSPGHARYSGRGIGRSRERLNQACRSAGRAATRRRERTRASEVPRPASRSSAAAPPSATTGTGTWSTCAGPRPSSRSVTGPRTPTAAARRGADDALRGAARCAGPVPPARRARHRAAWPAMRLARTAGR